MAIKLLFFLFLLKIIAFWFKTGYHWENSQSTLHPFAVYFKNDVGEVKCLSICIITDSMKQFKHDSSAVHALIHSALIYVKESFQQFPK